MKRNDITISPSKVPMPCRDCEKRTATCRLECIKYKIYSIAKNAERKKQAQERQAEADISTHIIENCMRIKEERRRSRR